MNIAIFPFRDLAPLDSLPFGKLVGFITENFPEFEVTEARIRIPFGPDSDSKPVLHYESWIATSNPTDPNDATSWLGYASVAQPRAAPGLVEANFHCLNASPAALNRLWTTLDDASRRFPIQMGGCLSRMPWLSEIYKKYGYAETGRSLVQELTLTPSSLPVPVLPPGLEIHPVSTYIQGDLESPEALRLGQLIVETDLDVPMPPEFQNHDPAKALARCFREMKSGDENTAFSYILRDQREADPSRALKAFIVHGAPKGDQITIHNLGVANVVRGQGLATLIKTGSAARLASDHGIRSITTRNHTTNASVLGLNKKLGYLVIAEHILFRRQL